MITCPLEINVDVHSLGTLLIMVMGICFAHGQRDYKGKIIDSSTGEPIPYVNIGIIEQGIGTVSDEEGLFHLYFEKDKVEKTAVILFSALGYAALNIPVAEIPLVYNEYPVFRMEPERVALNEVVVSNKGEKFISKSLGYKNINERMFGYWKDNISLGAELATCILAKKGIRKLERFIFEVRQNNSDSLLIRINFYDDDGPGRKPGSNLNKSGKSVLSTIKKNEKRISIDLKPFDIYVNDDFIASIELVKFYGSSTPSLVLAATLDRYGSYRRYASQGRWERISDINMAYYLETSLLVSKKVAGRNEKREANKKSKQRSITGFAISKGKMIPNVKVVNRRTNEIVNTTEDGRYKIAAKENDILEFSREGFKTLLIKITEKPTANVLMKLAD